MARDAVRACGPGAGRAASDFVSEKSCVLVEALSIDGGIEEGVSVAKAGMWQFVATAAHVRMSWREARGRVGEVEVREGERVMYCVMANKVGTDRGDVAPPAVAVFAGEDV